MAKKTDQKFIAIIDTGVMDIAALRGNIDNLAEVADEHADELIGLATKQTQTVSYCVDTIGITTIVNGNKHLRIKITNAFLQAGDSVPKNEVIEIVGITNAISLKSSEKAGKVRVFDILKKHLMFNEDIKVKTSGDRRVIINVTYESGEV